MRTQLKNHFSLINSMIMIVELFMLFMITILPSFCSHMMMDLWEFLISQQKITKANRIKIMAKVAKRLNKPKR